MAIPGGINLATKYSNVVDERFTRESQAMLALNNDYEFKGDKTVKVYSIPVVPMVDYTRSGVQRYGTPTDLSRNVQTLTVTKDRAFTFIIDAGDKIQSQMLADPCPASCPKCGCPSSTPTSSRLWPPPRRAPATMPPLPSIRPTPTPLS